MCGIVVVGWLTIGSQVALEAGQIVNAPLPLSTAGCPSNSTASPLSVTSRWVWVLHSAQVPACCMWFLMYVYVGRPEKEYAFALYRVSFLWYCSLSLLITVTVGVVVSAASRLLQQGWGAKAGSTGGSAAASPAACWVAAVPGMPSESSLGSGDVEEDARPEKLLVRSGDKDERSLQVSVLGRLPVARSNGSGLNLNARQL